MSTTSLAPVRALAAEFAGPSALKEAKDRLNTFRLFVKDVLVKGVDYATIPGTTKDTLLKAGAERIAQLYGLTAEFEEVVVHEDWSATPPFFSFRLRCRMRARANGEIVGEGAGSANSRESKYAYRVEYWNDRKNKPAEGQGWESFRGKFGEGWRRRIQNLETPDVANTVLKMAKKRAFVDAVLTVAAASEFFAQDLEDMPVDRGALEGEATGIDVEAAAAPLLQRIADATSVPALQAVSGEIQKQPAAVRNAVRNAYGNRLRSLRSKEPAPQDRDMREPGSDDDEGGGR